MEIRPRPTGAPKLTYKVVFDDFASMRGAGTEDHDPRAVREILDAVDALEEQADTEPHRHPTDPVSAAVAQRGTLQKNPCGEWIIALHGLVASAYSERQAFHVWRAMAHAYLTPEAVA